MLQKLLENFIQPETNVKEKRPMSRLEIKLLMIERKKRRTELEKNMQK